MSGQFYLKCSKRRNFKGNASQKKNAKNSKSKQEVDQQDDNNDEKVQCNQPYFFQSVKCYLHINYIKLKNLRSISQFSTF